MYKMSLCSLKETRFVKRIICLILALSLALSLSMTCYASDGNRNKDRTNNTNSTSSASSISKTIVDKDKNKYAISFYSNRSGKKAYSYTGFQVTYYYGGTDSAKKTVDSYQKELYTFGTATLSGGGKTTYGFTEYNYSASGANSKSQTCLYTVTLVTTSHKFSCNGASYSAMTYM